MRKLVSAMLSAYQPALEEAVLAGKRLHFRYLRDGQAEERTVDPIGLVAKDGRWYLLAPHDGQRRTYRLSRMSALNVLEEPAATRVVGVADEWDDAQRRFSERAGGTVATVLVTPGWTSRLLAVLARNTPERVPSADRNGRIAYRLRFPGVRAAVGSLGGFGGATPLDRFAVAARAGTVDRRLS